MSRSAVKEDAQLICPISYDDPDICWNDLQKDIVEMLPLREVTWKHPTSSVYITIPKLPLKFLPSSAALFKETDHPFRWFLAPYVYMYITSVDSAESYKAVKPVIKQWTELHSSKGNYWVILYAPKLGAKEDIVQKILKTLSSDFHMDKSGDRTIRMHSGHQGSKLSANTSAVNELFSKIREGITALFQLRVARYDHDIRQLDSFRGSPQLQFSKLFLLKESLALMYQMFQLPGEALVQYEDLEALLAFAPVGVLPEPEWPWVYVDSTKSSQSQKPDETKNQSSSKTTNILQTNDSAVNISDGWIGACRNGDDVLLYSMNNARTRILRNQISLWELYRYVMAREFHFLSQLNRPYGCCEKGYNFIMSIRGLMDRHLDEPELSTKMLESKNPVTLDRHQIQVRKQQCDIWAIASSVKIARACFDAIKAFRNSTEKNVEQVSSSSAKNTSSGIVWDDLNMPCLNILHDLLQFASFKLIRLLEGEKECHKQVFDIAHTFCSWKDRDTTVNRYNDWLITSSSQDNMYYGDSTLDMNSVLSDVSTDNKAIIAEELLARVSRRLRHMAISSLYNTNGGKRRRIRVATASTDMTEYLGTSPSTFPWMEQGKPSFSNKEDWRTYDKSKRDSDMDYTNDLSSSPSRPHEGSITFTLKKDYPIAVELGCILAEFDILLNRRRSAYREKCKCGDVLFVCGNMPRAMEFYCDAVLSLNASSDDTSSIMTFKAILPPVRLGYEELDIVDKIYRILFCSESINSGWHSISFELLRKMLLGLRLLENNLGYLMIALELLKPKYNNTSDKLSSDSKSLIEDIERLAILEFDKLDQMRNIQAKYAPIRNSWNNIIAVPFNAYFSINSSFYRSSSSVEGCDLSIDDLDIDEIKVPVLVARHEIGTKDPMVLNIEIESRLTHPIKIDKIIVLLRPFSYDIKIFKQNLQSMLASVASTENAGYIQPENELEIEMIQCQIDITRLRRNEGIDALGVDDKIVLYPGKQVIPFSVKPNTVGDYCIHEIIMQIGNSVSFFEDLSDPIESPTDPTSMKKISKRFRKEIIRFHQEANILELEIRTPSLSPVGKIDMLEITLQTKANETVENFRFDVNRISAPTYHVTNDDSAYSTSSSPSTHKAITAISFDSAEHWYVSESKASSEVLTYKCPTVISYIDGKPARVMKGISLKSDMFYRFQIPYVCSSADLRIGDISVIHAICNVTGKVFRQGCTVPLNKSIRLVISTSIIIDITSWSLNLTSTKSSASVYRQYQIKNVSSIPIDIIAYQTNITNSKTTGHDKHLVDMKSSIEIADDDDEQSVFTLSATVVNEKPLSRITLYPQEEYFKALKVTFNDHSKYSTGESIMKQFEMFKASDVKFIYVRHQAYLQGHENSINRNDYCEVSAPLIEAWSDFESYAPRVDWTLSAHAATQHKLGDIVSISFNLTANNSHKDFHTYKKCLVNVSPAKSAVWSCIGVSKVFHEISFHSGEGQIKFDFKFVALAIGKWPLPTLQVKYWIDENLQDEGPCDMISPFCDDILIISRGTSTFMTEGLETTKTLSRLVLRKT